MKRAWMKKVKAVPGCEIENETLEGKLKHRQPKVKLQLFKTSAATIGLIASIGTPNLLLTMGSDRTPAAQASSEGESTTQAAPALETVQGASNLVPETAVVQITPASAPIEVQPAQKLQPQLVKSDRLAERLSRRQATQAKAQHYTSAPTKIELEAATSARSPKPTYLTPAPQAESAAPVVQANIEPVETATTSQQPIQAGNQAEERLVARLKANTNATNSQAESHQLQSASGQKSTTEQLAVQPQPVIGANSAWTEKQRLLIEVLKQKEQSNQLFGASEPTSAVNLPPAQTANEQKLSPSNNSVVVETQPVQPTVPATTPQPPEVAANSDRAEIETTVQPSSVDRLLNRLGLPQTRTTEEVGSSAAGETANTQQLPAEVEATDKTQVVANDRQTEPTPQSVFVLPEAETLEIPTKAEDGQIQVATTTAPVSPPASAEFASVTLEVVSDAEGSSLAKPEPEYEVKPGDTLTRIATEHKVSVPAIANANQLHDPNLLLVNQRIKIPSLVDKKKVEKVTVAMLPEVEPAFEATNKPKQAVLVAANSSQQQTTDAVNQLPANSYNGVGGSIVDEVGTPTLSQAELEKLQARYAQKLQSDVQKLQHKYYAQNNGNFSAQAVSPRLPEVSKPPAINKLSVDEPVNPEFVVAQTARDLKPAQPKQLTIKTNYAVPAKGRVATAPTDIDSSQSFRGQQVSPELPPLAPVENYLPQPSGGSSPFKGYIWPAKGRLSSPYGWRWGRMHRGIDIAAPVGTPIFAVAEGVVVRSGWNRGGYGNLVDIQHPDGTLTRYAHNYRLLVQPGQQVTQGQQISLMGSTGRSTGPHLHFEVHPNGKGAVNPIALLPPKPKKK